MQIGHYKSRLKIIGFHQSSKAFPSIRQLQRKAPKMSIFTLAVFALIPVFTVGQKVVTTDPSNAKLNGCLKNATGPITSQLNKPISNGIFTFYGASGTAACGQDAGKPEFSAAASGQLFNPSAQWVKPCTGSQYVLNDAICINKCVKITYKCVGCSAAKT